MNLPPILFLALADAKIDVDMYQSAGVAVWTLNDYYRVFPGLKPDRIFEIHKPFNLELLQSDGRYPGDYRKIYNESGAQIVTRHFQGFENEKIFPLETAIETFGPNFFVSTTSFMFALAIMEGYQDITVEGIHLTRGDQHDYMTHGMLRNIDAARARNIEVRIPGRHEFRWREQAKTTKEEWREVYG
jgi:hypothetical protein